MFKAGRRDDRRQSAPFDRFGGQDLIPGRAQTRPALFMIDRQVTRSKGRPDIRSIRAGGASKGMVVDELNRDLLVAVLALLTDAIPRPASDRGAQCLGSGSEAVAGRTAPARGCIDAERLHALECLASSHLSSAS